uniref:Uncharacterized protein n=1 Tax=Parascaris univalens TaxID=6257 RepID=A0A915AUN7_PARUN
RLLPEVVMLACCFACQQANNLVNFFCYGKRVRQSCICWKTRPDSGNAYFRLSSINCLFLCLYLLTVLLFDQYISLFLILFFQCPFSVKFHKGDSAFLCLIMPSIYTQRRCPHFVRLHILVISLQTCSSGCICSKLADLLKC